MSKVMKIDYIPLLWTLELDNRTFDVNNDDTFLLEQCRSVARVRSYGPSLSVDPMYEPSPAPSMLGAFVVGSTPYLPYVFWSIET